MAKKQTDLISFPIHLSREVERLFDELIHRPWGFCREIRGWNPSIDVYETADAFVLEADLPGVKLEDVKVAAENGDLVVSGWRAIEKRQSEGQFHTMERSSGNFTRRIKLPESIAKDAIEAEFHDGVLRVTLPKLKEKMRGESDDRDKHN
jgi:HSP20 family protein